MVNIEKISNQILHDGLYNTLLFEIKEKLSVQIVTKEMVKNLLKSDSFFTSEYKEINRQSELSSIQIQKVQIKDDETLHVKDFKEGLNENIQTLKNLENFETDSKNSAYLIWIGSIGVMVLFMVHNVIALFSELYTAHETLVYGLYMLILFFTYLGYLKIKKNHDMQHEIFHSVYLKTKKMLKFGFQNSYFSYDEVYIN